MVDSVLSIGLQGVQQGVSSARQAAQDVVAATTVDTLQTPTSQTSSAGAEVVPDLATALVDLKISEHQVEASAAVIRTADEIMGTIINIKI